MGAGCFCVGSPLGRRRLTVLSCASTAPRVQAGIYLHVNDVNASTHDTTVEWSVPCTTVYIYYIYEVRIIYMYSICIAPRVRPVRRHMGDSGPPLASPGTALRTARERLRASAAERPDLPWPVPCAAEARSLRAAHGSLLSGSALCHDA